VGQRDDLNAMFNRIRIFHSQGMSKKKRSCERKSLLPGALGSDNNEISVGSSPLRRRN